MSQTNIRTYKHPNERWFGDSRQNPLFQWAIKTDDIVNAGYGLGTGQVFYVDSGVSTTGDGSSWERASSTLAAAIAKCEANRGDVILVAQGHAETWETAAGSATLDKAGVSIIGMGFGDLKPTITMTHVDATMTVSGANCRLSNLRFLSNLDNVKVLLTMTATSDGSIVDRCEFRDSAANKDYLVGISVAAAANNVAIIGNDFKTTAAAGGNNAILSLAVTDLNVIGNTAYGKFATGVLLTTGVLTRAVITDNIFCNAEAAIAIALNGTTSTGVLARNLLGGTTSIAAALTGEDAMWCWENYVTGAPKASGIIDPTVDSD